MTAEPEEDAGMGTHRRTAIGVAGPALILATVLAACGPQDNPPGPPSASASTTFTTSTTDATPAVSLAPEELLRQATRNMLDAPSKRLTGTASIQIASQEFDVVYVGDDALGTHTSRALGMESVVEFIRIGENLYIRAGEGYWQFSVQLEQLHLVVDTWVLVSADNPRHSALLVLFEDDSLWESVGDVTQVDTDTIDGTPVVVLEDSAGSRFTVNSEGTPYLLRAEGKQSTDAGEASVEITFSEFGTVAETIEAPSGEIVDIR